MPPQIRNLILIALAFGLISGSRTIANFIIEYQWWKEVEQVDTWLSMLFYRIAPGAGGALVMFLALWTTHRVGLRFAGSRARIPRPYAWLVPVALAAVAIFLAATTVNYWTLMTFAGSRGIQPAPEAWKDPVFGRALPFYLFDLPFYSELLRFLFTLSILAVVVFWLTARGWQFADAFRQWRATGGTPETFPLDTHAFQLPGATQTGFARVIVTILLASFAAWIFLGNYKLLLNTHAFMTGADYVDERFTLLLRRALFFGAGLAIPFAWIRRYKIALALLGVPFALQLVVPRIVSVLYVRPNEITIERPYIERHIQASQTAFGLNRRATERPFSVSTVEAVDPVEHATLLENIRLWDWRAYSDTISQIQALRPYYVFPDTDVDRYTINGRIKQVLLSPRELDVRQLPTGAQSWPNLHLVYTHGFGLVVSEVNKTTADGLPVLLVQDAPPEIKSAGFTLSRPEIYFGESVHEPVLVNTKQEEFDYPAGDQNKSSRYQGSGGFPISSLFVQAAAAVALAEPNILLTGQYTDQSRMMIHRHVRQRLEHVAGFLHWDPDPYLVVGDDGRLVWIVDGYTTSESHPYSALLPVAGLRGGVNYIRNAVKATVDAYTGKMILYVFEPDDPIIQAYQNLFPTLFRPAAEMPADARRHVRYPEALFRTQAEAYRVFHMRDPQVFYNKEDVWDIARSLFSQSGKPEPMSPTYIVATLPGERQPEFLLMLPFAPRGKDNLIGWMAARCDGDKLGELIFFQLSKQQLVYGPMQIESRIDSDQNISKDLSLWNQQGSRVLRGNMIALPIHDGFLYVESIYIQALEARMPQLKKIVLAMGNRLIYRDTFEQALGELTAGAPRAAPAAATAAAAAAAPVERAPALADRLRRLREQAQQLARDLEAVEREAIRK